jgi:flagellar L-ring protein precursor FlgH
MPRFSALLPVTGAFLFAAASANAQQANTTANHAAQGSSTRERPVVVPVQPPIVLPVTAPVVPPPEPANPSSLMSRNGGSLLRASLTAAPDPNRAAVKNVSVFAVAEPEPKTIQKHALVTIIIREESAVSSQGTSDLKRQSDIDATLEEMARLNVANLALEPAIGAVKPSVKASASRNFKGEATVDRTDTVVTRVTAEVVDVKPNGTLVLQARKKIKTDEEEQTLICSGICRVEDLTPDNTVLSTQLFDLEFSKMNKGQVRNTTKTGAIHKLLDFINPF